MRAPHNPVSSLERLEVPQQIVVWLEAELAARGRLQLFESLFLQFHLKFCKTCFGLAKTGQNG